MPALSISGQPRQRQVIILAVGGLLLGGLLLFQVPRTLEMLKSEETTSSPPPAQTTPTPVAPTPVAPTPTPVTPVAPAPTPPATLGTAALARFKSKDPFVQQIDSSSPSGEGASTESSTSAPPEPTAEAGAFRAVEGSTGSGSAATGETATIAVNGAEETVNVSNGFPQGNPVFRLVSIGDGTAKVGIASGTLKGGAETVTLTQGEPLTLLNTVDGKRYKLELVSTST